MKKFIFLILILLMTQNIFAADISANFVVDYLTNKTFKDTLTAADKDSVYITFPIHNRSAQMSVNGENYLSKTLPTGSRLGSSRKVFDITGDVDLHIRCTTESGASNSVALWTKYFAWCPDSSRFEIARHDSTFLDLDTPGVFFASTADTLDFITGNLYICPVSSHIKAEPGFVLYYSTDDSDAVFYIEIWISITRHVTPQQP